MHIHGKIASVTSRGKETEWIDSKIRLGKWKKKKGKEGRIGRTKIRKEEISGRHKVGESNIMLVIIISKKGQKVEKSIIKQNPATYCLQNMYWKYQDTESLKVKEWKGLPSK